MLRATRLSHLWYAFLLKFPLPAGDKWQVSLKLLHSEICGFSQVAKKKEGMAQGEALVARSLHQAGRSWVEGQLPRSTSPLCHPGEVADTLMIVLKTLDLPSRVQTNDSKITVTTFRCPFLEEARRSGEPAAVICERTCGEIKSLFKGFSEGFPSFMQYRAPKMMGTGADVCIKEFNLAGVGQHPPRTPHPRVRKRKGISSQEPPQTC
jgi:hypothetical protein